MEIIFKMAGSILVLGSSGYFAYSLNARLDQRGTELRRLYSILLQLKSEIQYMSNPLPICFEKLGGQEQAPFSDWFFNMARRLQDKDRMMFADVWIEETEQLYEQSALKREDMEPLFALRDKLGTLDTAVQSKALDYAALQIEHNRKNLEEENDLIYQFICWIYDIDPVCLEVEER
ncbi:MAG: stage III sporulation protein AB [Lachnospiraceae bacterium]|nr:stage III sporulation protein AB [Lachnospiraceae bacterium]